MPTLITTYWHPQILRPSDGPAYVLYVVFKIVETIVQFLLNLPTQLFSTEQMKNYAFLKN